MWGSVPSSPPQRAPRYGAVCPAPCELLPSAVKSLQQSTSPQAKHSLLCWPLSPGNTACERDVGAGFWPHSPLTPWPSHGAFQGSASASARAGAVEADESVMVSSRPVPGPSEQRSKWEQSWTAPPASRCLHGARTGHADGTLLFSRSLQKRRPIACPLPAQVRHVVFVLLLHEAPRSLMMNPAPPPEGSSGSVSGVRGLPQLHAH